MKTLAVYNEYDDKCKDIFGKKEFFCASFNIEGLLPQQTPAMEMVYYRVSDPINCVTLPWLRTFELYQKMKTRELPCVYLSSIRIGMSTGEYYESQTYVYPYPMEGLNGMKIVSPYDPPGILGHKAKVLQDNAADRYLRFDSAPDGRLFIGAWGKEIEDGASVIPIDEEEASYWPDLIRFLDRVEDHAGTENRRLHLRWSPKPTYMEFTISEPATDKLPSENLDNLLAESLATHAHNYFADIIKSRQSDARGRSPK